MLAATHTTAGITRRTYRGLVYGVVGIGILGLLVGLATDRHLVGTVVYLLGSWIGGVIAVVAPRWSDQQLQDERDDALHNRASGLAMGITMALGIGIVPALYVLEAGGYVDLTGAIGGGILVASALFLLYGVCFGIVKRRP
jgi:hypothetical protein